MEKFRRLPWTFTYPKGEILLDIGGKDKTQNQVILNENHVVFSDDLEIVGGSKSRITYLDF